MWLDERVRVLVEDFLQRLNAVRSGLVDAVYVTGSALTDDWQPRHSDVDVVLVVSRPVELADIWGSVVLRRTVTPTAPDVHDA